MIAARHPVRRPPGRVTTARAAAPTWAPFQSDLDHALDEELTRAELWLFPALFILLLLFIRSLTAALLPLAVAGASLALSFAVLGWAGIPGRGGRGSAEMPTRGAWGDLGLLTGLRGRLDPMSFITARGDRVAHGSYR
ncbi:MMPL family transporter [Kitasatospora sp. NPDC059812]|uniref:MMPL family transporter n=1 Tax=Kitasatospora sp. NPDC059812 TaxID=3346958 RepID=UPI003654D2FC